MSLLTILLQAAGGSQQWSGILMMVVIVAIFYFFMIRPQQKKQKEIQKAREALKAGDKETNYELPQKSGSRTISCYSRRYLRKNQRNR